MPGLLRAAVDSARWSTPPVPGSVITSDNFDRANVLITGTFISDASLGGRPMVMASLEKSTSNTNLQIVDGRLLRQSTGVPAMGPPDVGCDQYRVSAQMFGMTGNSNHFGYVMAMTNGDQSTVNGVYVACRVGATGVLQYFKKEKTLAQAVITTTATGIWTEGAEVFIQLVGGRLQMGIGTTVHIDQPIPVIAGSGRGAGLKFQGATYTIPTMDNFVIQAL